MHMFVIPGWIVALVTFPGVMLHEIAHALACNLVGVRVYRTRLFKLSGNTAGYVQHARPRSFFQAFVISTAPLVVNSFAAMLTFYAALKLPPDAAIFGIKERYILYWLGFSFAMHAFPSTGDANNVWRYGKSVWKRNPLVILTFPLLLLIYLADAARILWFDLFYAFALLAVVFAFAGGAGDPVTAYLNDLRLREFGIWVKESLITHSAGISLNTLLIYVVGAIALIVTVKVAKIGYRKFRRWKSSRDRAKEWDKWVREYETQREEKKKQQSTRPLYGKCAYCGKYVYMPYRCTYCGKLFCDEHRLPFQHECEGMDEYRASKPPGGGRIVYRRK